VQGARLPLPPPLSTVPMRQTSPAPTARTGVTKRSMFSLRTGASTRVYFVEKRAEDYHRLGLVFTGLMLAVFLSALDQVRVTFADSPLFITLLQTIVATALPTIIADLGGGNLYSWVGSAYLLAAASLSPLYGRLSDIVGRKPILYGGIVIFLVSFLNAIVKSVPTLTKPFS
jgi:hypothetical protein